MGTSSALSNRAGFTLIELMVAIFLTLILMLAISRVFQLIEYTVGTGTAIMAMNQNARSLLPVVTDDFRCATGTDQPWVIIRNDQLTAFMDQKDQLFDSYYSGGSALGGIGSLGSDGFYNGPEARMLQMNVGGQHVQVSRALYGQRSHRVDWISLFAAGRFRSGECHQSALATFGSPLVASDAYISYGMCHLPLNGGTFGSNDDWGQNVTGDPDFYARNWVLGRQVMMLCNPLPTDPTTGSACTGYITYNSANRLSPLSGYDAASDSSNIYASHFDLAKTTISLERAYGLQLNVNVVENVQTNTSNGYPAYQIPFNYTKPVTAQQINLFAPALLQNCSSFVVEFAGDFFKQYPDGSLKPTASGSFWNWQGQDGQIDFYIDPVSGAKKIRWYGLPRDTNSDGHILASTPQVWTPPANDALPAGGLGQWPANMTNPNYLVDVVPLRDVIKTANDTASFAQYGLSAAGFFEGRTTTAATTNPTTSLADYADPIYGMQGNGPLGGSSYDYNDGKYFCAWHAGQQMPSMVRFIITLEDPNARAGSQTFEYVMNLQ